jgi:hypothetical protein
VVVEVRPLIAALLVVGCGAGGREAPVCGNEVVESSDSIVEECDDGELNGTTESVCSTECTLRVHFGFEERRRVELPFAPRRLVYLDLANDWLIITGYDEQGIVLMPPGGVPQTLRVHASPTAFAVGHYDADTTLDLLWIERGTIGTDGPWMLMATIQGDAAATIQELPYPIPGGQGGTFLLDDAAANPPVLTDLVGGRQVWVVLDEPLAGGSPVDLGPSTATPAFGVQLDHMLGTDILTPRGVQFLDGPTEVTAASYRFETQPSLVLEYSGSWPDTPVWADDGAFRAGHTLPDEVAVMGSDGVVRVWDFVSPPGETEDLYFGRFPVGTQQFRRVPSTEPYGLVAVLSDGHLGYIANDGNGKGLPPVTFPLGTPCVVCAVGEASEPNEQPRWFVLDRVAIEGSIVINNSSR